MTRASSQGRRPVRRSCWNKTDGLDAVVAPIGGGGMISGTCLTMSNLAPDIKIYAAEPEQADDAYRVLQGGSHHR